MNNHAAALINAKPRPTRILRSAPPGPSTTRACRLPHRRWRACTARSNSTAPAGKAGSGVRRRPRRLPSRTNSSLGNLTPSEFARRRQENEASEAAILQLKTVLKMEQRHRWFKSTPGHHPHQANSSVAVFGKKPSSGSAPWSYGKRPFGSYLPITAWMGFLGDPPADPQR